MRRYLILCVAVFLVGICNSPAAAQDSPESQGQKILAQAREAAGGEAKLRAVQSLAWSGKSRRQVMMRMGGGGGGEGQSMMREAEFESEALLPDKYQRKDTTEIMNGSATMISTSGFNGDALIQKMETIGEVPNFMSGNPPTPTAEENAQRVRRMKQDFVRQWMGWLFEPPASLGITFRSAGQEDSKGVKLDVVEASGPDQFNAKLYFDSASHRLVKIRYRAPQPRMQRVMMGGGGRAEGPPPPQEPPADADYESNYSDFRAVDGIQIPHKIVRTMNGEPADETELKKVRINPNLKPDRFKTK